MIKNETLLEELFYDMLEEMKNDMYGDNLGGGYVRYFRLSKKKCF